MNAEKGATSLEEREARMAADIKCRCSHAAMAHEHFRRGTDCALCECSALEV